MRSGHVQPGLSVVVYGPEARGHLAELLDSLAAQPFTGVEIVLAAVGERARREAERAAQRDGRVRALPLPADTDEAAARTAGAEHATGAWLHFVRAEDALPPGTPRVLAERTAELPPEVQVLAVDHVRSTWDAPGARSGDGWIFARTGRRTPALADFPNMLRLTPLLGARVVRAEFWRAHEALPATREAAGEEAYLAYSLLLHADRIAFLHQPAYERRVPRPESLPPPAPEDRYALIERYERLHRLMAEREVPGRPRAVLYDVMVRDCLRTFARSGMPEPVAREFFARASRAAVTLRPEGHRRPGGFEGIRRSLLEENAYTRYRALQAANQRRRTVRKAVLGGRRIAAALLHEQRYRRALSGPVDPRLAVFSAYWDRGVACNPAAIARRLAALAPDIHQVWVVSRDRAALLPPGTDHVVPGTRRYWEVMARAKYLVNNVNFPDAVVKRPGAVHLQTHHGTPLKRMGLDQLDFPAAAKGLDFEALLARVDKWDYSVSANSHSTRMWERAYPSRYTPSTTAIRATTSTTAPPPPTSARSANGSASPPAAARFSTPPPTATTRPAGTPAWTSPCSRIGSARTPSSWCAATTSTATPPPRSPGCAAPAG